MVLGDHDHDGKIERAVVTRDFRYRIESSNMGTMGAGAIPWDWQLPAPTCLASSP